MTAKRDLRAIGVGVSQPPGGSWLIELARYVFETRRDHALLHKAWREEALPSFELHFLPPYSPELNPIERLWKLTRRLWLHNTYFPTLDEVCHGDQPE